MHYFWAVLPQPMTSPTCNSQSTTLKIYSNIEKDLYVKFFFWAK